MKKHALDIFEVLGQLDIKNRKYYDKPTEDEQNTFEKAFQPLVVMRWFSGTYSVRQIYFLNEFVNTNIWSFTKDHKRLLFYLLVVCSEGKSKKYVWNANQKVAKYPKATECIQRYFQYNAKQAREAIPLLSTKDIIECAEDLGMQPDEIKAITKELKV